MVRHADLRLYTLALQMFEGFQTRVAATARITTVAAGCANDGGRRRWRRGSYDWSSLKNREESFYARNICGYVVGERVCERNLYPEELMFVEGERLGHFHRHLRFSGAVGHILVRWTSSTMMKV